MSIGENWFAPQPTANVTNAILTQAVGFLPVTVGVMTRPKARAYLKKLIAGGLVLAQPSGRRQLYSIALAPVADALEILILLGRSS